MVDGTQQCKTSMWECLAPTTILLFNLHAAETCGVLRFAHAVLVPRYGAFLGDSHIHFKMAVSSCIVMLDIIREFDVLPTNPAIQRFCDNTVVHLRALEALQIP